MISTSDPQSPAPGASSQSTWPDHVARWRDVDFDSPQIAIVQTVSMIDGKIMIGHPFRDRWAGSRFFEIRRSE